jgi:hypothetical protein
MKKCILIFILLGSFSLFAQTLQQRKALLLKAISYRESHNGLYKENKTDGSAGLLGIRWIMVKEVNLIVGYNKYKLSDRLNDKKAIEIFTIYQNFVNPKWDFELGCKRWNGGRRGERKISTQIYWNAILLDGQLNNK